MKIEKDGIVKESESKEGTIEFTPHKDDGSDAFKDMKKAEKSNKFGTVSGSVFVNIRSGPGMDFDVVTMLREGSEIKIVEEKGDWYHVAFKNNAVIGYINKDFVTV